MKTTTESKLDYLLGNSRFWILAIGITSSFLIAGSIQLLIPNGSLQIIRIEQFFGFISILLLYIAILASPLTKVFPNLKIKNKYIHARRAIGVLSFYYAFLHTYITFFSQLNGFDGIKYYNSRYSLSIILGFIGLTILCILATTSLDWFVDLVGFKYWKLLHRLIYVASVAIVVHVAIIGPHFLKLSLIGIITYVAIGFIVVLEIKRLHKAMVKPEENTH